MPQNKIQTLAEEDLEKVKAQVTKLINSDKLIANIVSKPLTSNITNATQYFTDVIKYYDYRYEESQGIAQYLDADIKSIVRVKQKEDIVADSSFAYISQGANCCRATLEYLKFEKSRGIINDQQFTTASEQIIKLFKESEAEISKITDKEKRKKYFDKKLVDIISDTLPEEHKSKEEISEDLDKAYDSVTLKDEHYHITTITKFGSKKSKIGFEQSLNDYNLGIVTDIKLNVFTGELREQILNINAEKDPRPEWYNVKSDYERFLVDQCAHDLVSSNFEKMLPTQFLKSDLVPGIRNAYLESSFGNKSYTKLDELGRACRSSIPIMHSTDKDMDEKNSLMMLHDVEDGFILNPLISQNNNFITPDGYFSKVLSKYAEEKEIPIIQTPVNVMGSLRAKLNPPDMTEFMTLVNNARSYRPEDKEYQEKLDEYEAYLLDLSPSFYDKSCIIADMIQELKRGILGKDLDQTQKDEIPEILIFCKSGKDRTGLTFLTYHVKKFSKYYEEEGYDEKHIADCLIDSGHQQYLTGKNSCTTACYGLKLAMTGNPYGKKKILGPSTAGGNAFKPYKHNLLSFSQKRKRSSISDIRENSDDNYSRINPQQSYGSNSQIYTDAGSPEHTNYNSSKKPYSDYNILHYEAFNRINSIHETENSSKKKEINELAAKIKEDCVQLKPKEHNGIVIHGDGDLVVHETNVNGKVRFEVKNNASGTPFTIVIPHKDGKCSDILHFNGNNELLSGVKSSQESKTKLDTSWHDTEYKRAQYHRDYIESSKTTKFRPPMSKAKSAHLKSSGPEFGG